MAVNNTEFAAISLATVQGMGTWFALMPSLDRVTDSDINDDDFRVRFRQREMVVAGVTVAVGIVGSVALKSKTPILVSMAILVVLATSYEVMLRIEMGESFDPFSPHDTDNMEDTDNE